MGLAYAHVDVFSQTPYGGNSLPVFLDAGELRATQMLQITQELRHFESIFLETKENGSIRARVFDLFEELPFAGHPIIGAAAVLHHNLCEAGQRTWHFELRDKTVSITTTRNVSGYSGLLDQGQPNFLNTIDDRSAIADAFNLSVDDLDRDLPLQVISTGLSYLIVPVVPGALKNALITDDISELLHNYDAQFAVLLDNDAVEVRHWNNDGVIEDVATGSAAGTIGAYRLRHRLTPDSDTFTLNQGRFTGRPSTLQVCPHGTPDNVQKVLVGGDVAIVGHGVLEVLP